VERRTIAIRRRESFLILNIRRSVFGIQDTAKFVNRLAAAAEVSE
jgi:hypothetical protein